MLKTLVSLNADLASSIALRYACQMASFMQLELQTIHVEEPGAEGKPLGTGWVRRSWEKAMLETGQEEISQLIQAEKTHCPPLAATKMCIGDREEEILNELRREHYDLFMEGILYTFTPTSFYKKIQSRVYRQASCPIILVKNLTSLNRVVILLGAEMDHAGVLDTFLKMFGDAKVDIDLCYYRFQQAGGTASQENPESVLSAARKKLAAVGRTANSSRLIQESPEAAAELLGNDALVISSVQRSAHKKGPMIELLHRIHCPILFCAS